MAKARRSDFNSDTLLKLRHAADWNQDQLARKAWLSGATVSQLETGKTANPTVDTLVRLAHALGVDVSVLVQADLDDHQIEQVARHAKTLRSDERRRARADEKKAKGLEAEIRKELGRLNVPSKPPWGVDVTVYAPGFALLSGPGELHRSADAAALLDMLKALDDGESSEVVARRLREATQR